MPGIFLRSRAPGSRDGQLPNGERTLSWSRLSFAAGLLAALLGAALWTAGSPDYAEVHSVMIHSFELVLGAVLGILTGEAAHT